MTEGHVPCTASMPGAPWFDQEFKILETHSALSHFQSRQASLQEVSSFIHFMVWLMPIYEIIRNMSKCYPHPAGE